MCHGHAETGWQGWGGPEVQVSRTESSPLPLSQVAIPGLHRAVGLLEWKLVEDLRLNQEWLLLYFSRQHSP